MFSFNYYYLQITNGVFADYFTVLVRTGDADSGMFGLTMLVLEKSMKGINARQMKCSGVWPSGTALISFDNVAVPVANMVGDEGMGFKYAMTNFNRERMGICVQANRFARVCLEESMVHAQRRETFGKKLIDHPVIRNKLAHMARHIESTHALIELTSCVDCGIRIPFFVSVDLKVIVTAPCCCRTSIAQVPNELHEQGRGDGEARRRDCAAKGAEHAHV